ncbi:dynein beta chain, ciliary [Octopus bimaculoides]|nr:dynein beta chain, ciliary [Octopus bimaculoides]
MESIKQTVDIMYNKKMLTLTRSLSQQVTCALKEVDEDVKRFEDEIEEIYVSEKNMISFTRFIKLSNQLSLTQSKMHGDFGIVKKTMEILGNYEQQLPPESISLYENIPLRWNNIKSKVSQAKQNLEPIILGESLNIKEKLHSFNRELTKLQFDMEEFYKTRKVKQFEIDQGFVLIEEFTSRLATLEEESQDLSEIENILQLSVLNYEDLKICKKALTNMKTTWTVFRYIGSNHEQWQTVQWNKVDIQQVAEEISKEIESLNSLPDDMKFFDIYREILEEVELFQVCLGIVRGLLNSSLRPHHWRQLLKIVNTDIDLDSFNKITLNQFFSLKFQEHIDDVQQVVKCAEKEVSIEKSLQKCEEMWINQIFILKLHHLPKTEHSKEQLDLSSDCAMAAAENTATPDYTETPFTSRANSCHSISSLSVSRMNFQDAETANTVLMLANIDTLLKDLTDHQQILSMFMQNENISSLHDVINKWYSQLLRMETILVLWQKVQDYMDQLVEAFSNYDVQQLLPVETKTFRKAHLKYCCLMKSIEKAPNVMQNCSKKWIQPFLESVLYTFEKCHKALFRQIDHFQQLCPRFYFLSSVEVLQLLCYANNLTVLTMYLKKILSNIEDLQFIEAKDEKKTCYIGGVLSENYDYMQLHKPVACDGFVYQWLEFLLMSLEKSLYHHLTTAVSHKNVSETPNPSNQYDTQKIEEEPAYYDVYNPPKAGYLCSSDVTNLTEIYQELSWIIKMPPQLVSLIAKLNFYKQMDGILKDTLTSQEALKNYASEINTMIDRVSKLLRILEKEKVMCRKSGTESVVESKEVFSQSLIQGMHPHIYSQQITKLRCLLLCQCYFKDILVQMSESLVEPQQNFYWKVQLNYILNSEGKSVEIKNMYSSFKYGFEYLGVMGREMIFPVTQRSLVHLLRIITSFNAGLCIGSQNGQNKETAKDLSYCLGKAMYFVNCSSNITTDILHDVLKGTILTGCWLCLTEINRLLPSQLAQLVRETAKIMDAYKSGQLMVTHGDNEMKLIPGGAIIATLCSTQENKPYDPTKLPVYPSVTAFLPPEVIKHFRPVACLRPSFQSILESLLYVNGFSQTRNLSIKVEQFFSNIAKMSAACDKTMSSSSDVPEISCDDQFLGWNLKGVSAVVEGAAEKFVAENLCKTSDSMEESLQKTEEKVLMQACIRYLSPRLETQLIPFMKKLAHHIWPKSCEYWSELFGIDVNSSQDSSEKASSDICRDVDSLAHNLYTLIKDATSQLKLQASDIFCTQVSNLCQLTQFHSMVLIIGPAGCGKSCCIETFLATKNNYGQSVSVNDVFLKSQNSEELFGYVDPETKLWTCGLLPTLLGKVCRETQMKNLTFDDNSEYFKNIHLFKFDGMADEAQMQTLQTFIDGNGTVLLPNCEKISLTKEFLFFWELESMETLSPAFLTQVGILQMMSEDVSWTAYWHYWLQNQSDKSQQFWTKLADIYLPKLIEATKNSIHSNEISNDINRPFSNSRCFIKQGLPNKMHTLCALLNALQNVSEPVNYDDYNNIFCLAAVWSFSGTVCPQYHSAVDQWWRDTFPDHLQFPQDETVFDYGLDVKNHSFVKWTELEADSLISNKKRTDFTYSKKTLQLLFLSSIVALNNHPVLLAGPSGSGKTRIIKALLKTGDSIEISGMESLQIHANKLTTPQFLKDKLNNITGLKAKGIYRKLCFIDDLNCVQTDSYGHQPCLELIRQHLDKGGHYRSQSYNWQKITNITYIATVNSSHYPEVSARLLRHFAIFSCGSPDSEELAMIFSRHIDCLFPIENSAVNEEYPSTQMNGAKFYTFLQTLGACTIDIYTKLKSMFLSTPGRQHYIFSVNGLKSLFSNLCLSISSASQFDIILRLWYNECYWQFGRKMSTSVDFERYLETVHNSIRKYLTHGIQCELPVITEGLVFSNLFESDNGKVGADKKYQIVNDYSTIHHLLSKTASEYSKSNQPLQLPLYNVNLELICRVSRILSCCTAKCPAHMTVVTEGLSGSFYDVLYLSAFLTDWTPLHLQKCSANMNCFQQSLFLRNQLINICQQAGLKNKKIFLLVKDKDICNEEILELLLEYIVNGNLDYLFSQEQQDNIASSLKNDTNQSDFKNSSLPNMWQHFVRNIERNLKVCLVFTNRSKDYQKWCCKFSALVKNTNFIWLSHWARKELVENAMYHVNELTWLSTKQQENICHLLASMHSSLQQLLVQVKEVNSFTYCSNTTYQTFVQKFVDLAMKRYLLVSSDHSQCLSLHHQLSEVEQEVSSIDQLREHTSMLIEQCQLNSRMLLQQIGQNGTIIKQQENFVCLQKKAINKLRKLLPEFQVAHQRAVFKTVQIVVDTKKLVESLNIEELGQLKVMPKPVQEIVDIFAAIIIIVKSSTSELTWYKGAKRLMANLERFIGELMTFDEYTVSLSHLEILQDYVKKENFNPEYIDKISPGDSSCRILCQWVINVTNYNTTMMKKVKPLHEKVKETVLFIAEAEKQLKTFKDKLKKLLTCKAKLTHNFQEASLSAQKHEISLQNIDKFILDSPKIMTILKDEKNKLENAINVFEHRVEGITGITAIAAGLTSYLGPLHHRLRQLALTLIWKNLLVNSGIHLFYDKIDHCKGYTVEWSVESENSQTYNEKNEMKLKHEIPVGTIPYTIPEEEEDEIEEEDQDEKFSDENINSKRINEETVTLSEPDIPNEKSIPSEVFGNRMRNAYVDMNQQSQHHQHQLQQTGDMQNKQKQEFGQLENGIATDMATFLSLQKQCSPVQDLKPWPSSCSLTGYHRYLYSLIKVLAGEQQLNEWLKMDLNVHNLENAAILWSCQNNYLFLVDPHCFGQQQFEWQNKQKNKTNIDKLDLNQNWVDELSERFLRNMEIGKSTLLYNYSDQLQLNDTIECILSLQNMPDSDFVLKGKFLDAGCFSLSSKFRLCITSTSADISLPLDSGLHFTIVNYGSCRNMLTEDLKNHIFQILYPGLYKDYTMAVESLQTHKCSSISHYNFISAMSRLTPKLSSEYFQKWLQWNHYRNQEIKSHNSLVSAIEELEQKKCEIEEMAQQAALLYSLVYSLRFIKVHYSFPLSWFISILDQLLIDSNFIDKEEKEVLSPESYEHSKKSPDKKATNLISALDEMEFMQEYQFPNLPIIPSPRVYHQSLSVNETKKIIQSLMNIIINTMQMGLYQEDWLLFKLLLSLTKEMENADSDTWQQLALIVQDNPGVGIQLTLEDFQSNDKPPDWLPASVWENVLTLSVLNGPMDNFCIKLITNQELWEDWYHSECPEMETLPINLCEEDYESGDSEEFLRLLLIRNLRPDRFLKATELYLERCVSYTAVQLQFHDVLQASLPFKAILLSCPDNYIQQTDYQFGQMVPIEDKLLQLAAETGVAVKNLEMHSLVYGDIQEIFEDLVPYWLIIDVRNDCSKDCLEKLECCLDEIPFRQSFQKENILKSSLVWIIQKESQIFPLTLHKYLFKLSWTHLFRFGGDCLTDRQLYIQHLPSSPNCIDSVVCCVLTQINKYLKREASHINSVIKAILFGTIVAHSSLLASQALGSSGLDHWYPFDNHLLEEALQILLQHVQPVAFQTSVKPSNPYQHGKQTLINDDDDDDSKAALLKSLQIVPELYQLLVVKESDRKYIKILINDVLHQVVHRPMSDIVVAGYIIPVAPANVELCNYVRWFQNRMKETNFSDNHHFPHCISRDIDTFRNNIFFHKMNVVYDKQGMEELCKVGICQDLTSPNLWSSLELCTEKLPSCLDLPDIHFNPKVRTGFQDSSNYDIQNYSNVLWALWQECLNLNTLLLKVHRDVKYIKENFPEVLNKNPSLQGTIECLKQHQVSTSWLYSNWRSSPQILTTWLDDLNRQHHQLGIFLDKLSGADISNWSIKAMPLWLGGMANPETLLTAVKTDFCFLHKYSLDLVELCFDVVEMVQEANWTLVLTDLFLYGADWDYKEHCLQVGSFQGHHIPLAVLNIKLKTESNISSHLYDMAIYNCPIYINTKLNA